MNMMHKLITKEIQDEIKKSVSEKGHIPMYDLLIYEDDTITFLKSGKTDDTDNRPIKFAHRIAPVSICKAEVDNFLCWLSGLLIGSISTATV